MLLIHPLMYHAQQSELKFQELSLQYQTHINETAAIKDQLLKQKHDKSLAKRDEKNTKVAEFFKNALDEIEASQDQMSSLITSLWKRFEEAKAAKDGEVSRLNQALDHAIKNSADASAKLYDARKQIAELEAQNSKILAASSSTHKLEHKQTTCAHQHEGTPGAHQQQFELDEQHKALDAKHITELEILRQEVDTLQQENSRLQHAKRPPKAPMTNAIAMASRCAQQESDLGVARIEIAVWKSVIIFLSH